VKSEISASVALAWRRDSRLEADDVSVTGVKTVLKAWRRRRGEEKRRGGMTWRQAKRQPNEPITIVAVIICRHFPMVMMASNSNGKKDGIEEGGRKIINVARNGIGVMKSNNGVTMAKQWRQWPNRNGVMAAMYGMWRNINDGENIWREW